MATQYTITGVITGTDGSRSEFELHADLGSWSQWGETTEKLGDRVEYLDAMASGLSNESNYYNQPAEDSDDEEEAGE